MPLDRALAEIEANSGGQFSPRVARVVVELLRLEAETSSARMAARAAVAPLATDAPAPAAG
jgi:HD-GYP domain-containing protein (c-di-GMP phosphodiesterase class II)